MCDKHPADRAHQGDTAGPAPLKVEVVSRRRLRDDILSISAAIVAIAALVTSVWQAHSSSKHDRLSVRPLLAATTDFRDGAEPLGLLLENRGVGPAIIRKASLYLDGHLQGEMQPQTWDGLLQASKIWNDVRTSYWFFEPSSVVPTGKQFSILVLSKNWPRKFAPMLEDLVKRRLGVEICYCSLYDDCWRLVMADDQSSTDKGQCGLSLLKR